MAFDKDFPKHSRKASLLNVDKTLVIDYKNPQLLRSFLTDRGKIVPARISGMTARQQRQITRAIKRARMLALILLCELGAMSHGDDPSHPHQRRR